MENESESKINDEPSQVSIEAKVPTDSTDAVFPEQTMENAINDFRTTNINDMEMATTKANIVCNWWSTSPELYRTHHNAQNHRAFKQSLARQMVHRLMTNSGAPRVRIFEALQYCIHLLESEYCSEIIFRNRFVPFGCLGWVVVPNEKNLQKCIYLGRTNFSQGMAIIQLLGSGRIIIDDQVQFKDETCPWTDMPQEVNAMPEQNYPIDRLTGTVVPEVPYILNDPRPYLHASPKTNRFTHERINAADVSGMARKYVHDSTAKSPPCDKVWGLMMHCVALHTKRELSILSKTCKWIAKRLEGTMKYYYDFSHFGPCREPKCGWPVSTILNDFCWPHTYVDLEETEKAEAGETGPLIYPSFLTRCEIKNQKRIENQKQEVTKRARYLASAEGQAAEYEKSKARSHERNMRELVQRKLDREKYDEMVKSGVTCKMEDCGELPCGPRCEYCVKHNTIDLT
jgi:hypothetical protein